MDNIDLFRCAASTLEAGRPVALVTVIATTGSTPGKVGYKMLVFADGAGPVGTVGGGLLEEMVYDEQGQLLTSTFMDYLLPTAVEVPTFELGETVTPSPHHPLGCKGVGESATVGSPPAVVNAVIDALKPYGVRHADMPVTPAQVWMTMQGRPFRTDLAIED